MNILKAAAFDLGNTIIGQGITPVPGVIDALQALRERGLILVVASNADVPVEHSLAMLEQTGLRQYFTHVFNSYSLGVSKPDARFFHKIFTTLKIQPHECVMIGDSVYADIQGAKKVGMSAIWYAPLQNNPDSSAADGVIIHMQFLVPLIEKIDAHLYSIHQSANQS